MAAALSAVALGGCGGSGTPEHADALLFVSTRDGAYDLYASKADGSDQHRLTKDKGSAATPSGLTYQVDPAWSPDGRRIAFASSREGQLHVYVMDADGTHVRRLTSGTGEDRHPAWSPDGSKIAFTRGTPNRIEIMNADGTGLHPLAIGATQPAEEDDPAWSPDGRWIAFDRRTPGTPTKEIWLAHPDGSASHRLSSLSASSTWPTWAPSSKQVAFSSNGAGQTLEIFVVDLAGLRMHQLTDSPSADIQPAWSPDGKGIAFSRDGAITTVTLAGVVQRLTDPKNNDSSPTWKPKP